MSAEARQLGKYELHERLGSGGMGDVYKAFDPQLRRYVAIKLLNADLRNDPTFTSRFTNEAQLVASLHHPNIVRIHDFDFVPETASTGALVYMVMEYIPGQTLSDYMRETSRQFKFPPAADIVYLFTALGQALDYAHGKGVIHRDIKPANVLLDRRLATTMPMGEPILTDFGIARLQGGTAHLTMQGEVLGTPHYISPEQAQGKPGDQRSDLYSLGVMLYEIMTGVKPFRAETLHAILIQHLTVTPTPPHLVNPAIPPAASQVILTCLEKDPDARFSSASAMTTALAEALNVPTSTQFLPTLPSPGNSAMPGYSTQLYPLTTMPPASYPSSSSPATPFTPLPGTNAPMHPATMQNNNQGMPGYAPTEFVSPPPALSPAPAITKPGPKRGTMYIVLSVLLIGVLLGAAWAVYALSTRSSVGGTNLGTPAPAAIVGHLTFMKSAQASPGAFDELQIDLNSVPAPEAGSSYYAWLVSTCSGSESLAPHWALPISNNAIHTPPLTYQGNKNLFCPGPNSLLVISKEATNPAPLLATTPLYYAHVTQPASTTFQIMPCPPGGTSHVCESG
ncbi:MAG: serine/threonine protein kinase [Ktedonobacteraceae bacterium]|nr:serine/threonine protein kinase [Ktedonobacteraceae bacterium]